MRSNLQGQYAGAFTRGIAWTIDVALLVVIVAVTSWLVTASFGLLGITVQDCPANVNSLSALLCYGTRFGLAAFALLISPLYFIFFWTVSGQTIGNAVLGVRVVRMDGKPMTILRSIRRYIGYLICFLTLGLGFALMLVDDQRQGLHDTLARTCVIYSWRGEQNIQTIERLQHWMAKRKRSAGQEPAANSKA